MRALFLDGPNYLFRAYHALPPLTNSRGLPTHVVYGMSTMVWKLLRDEKPDYAAVAWDPPGPTFREARFADYKKSRSSMPDDLRQQIPLVMRLLAALRLPVLQVQGFEADDVLATLVDRCRAATIEVQLVTGDKDLLQLVDPTVTVLSTLGRTGETVRYDEAGVRAKWGVDPTQIPDLLALMGDHIDDIPGVPGVGQKTAVKLIGQFGSVEKLYESLPLVGGKLRETLAANRQQAFLSRELAVAHASVPLPGDLEELKRQEPDREALRTLWTEMEFHTLLRQLDSATPVSTATGKGRVARAPSAEVVAAPAELPPMLETAEALAEYLARVPAADALAIDVVWTGGPPEPVVEAVGLFHPDAGEVRVAPVLLLPALGSRRVVGHDVKPLVEWAAAHGLPMPAHDDTAVAAYLVNSGRQSEKLAELCTTELGQTPSAPPGARATWVRRLWECLAPGLASAELERLYADIELPLGPVLATMERHGIRVDSERLREFAKEMEISIDRLSGEIHELAGEAFNLGSPKQLATILFEKLKLPALRRTKTGYSTDADVLEHLALQHPLPAKLLEHRVLTKLKSTYADSLPLLINDKTGRIHTTFTQIVAATGRLSSNSPNLQNIPVRTELGRRIRAAFVPEPGWTFVAADYSQIELRLLAHVCGEESLVEAFRRGEDIHRRTAAEVFGVALESVSKEQREVAKTTNFSVIYGVTAFGLSRGLSISSKEAQEYLNRFFASHQKVKAYLQQTVAEGRERGWVQTLFGRRRYLPELRSSNPNVRGFAERMATNAPIQGTAADLVKIAMLRMAEALTARTLRSRMLLQVHDELLFEAPADEVDALTALATEVMESAMVLDVPLKVDVATGGDWSQV